MRKCLLAAALGFVPLTAKAVETPPKLSFIKADCNGPLGSEIVSSLKQEIRTSADYQLAKSLDDDGGYDVVLTIYIECSESALPTSERIVSLASIFGTGTCTGDICTIRSNESTLNASLCSGKSGAGCGKDLYATLVEYMKNVGEYIFRQLSNSRKTALSN